MVSGLHPCEASDRLSIFQAQFDELWNKFQTYSGGEQLFGLSVTEYPALQTVRKELGLLQKLYGLYNTVIDTVNGYYDILWTEVDIEKINSELIDFQNRFALHCTALVCPGQSWNGTVSIVSWEARTVVVHACSAYVM